MREIFPYQEILPIKDGRVREEHLALASLGLSGTGVYRRDDPMWDLFTPPWGYQCRCGVNLLTVEAAARKGVGEARRWERTGEPPVNPEHRLDAIPFRPEPDFVGGRRLSLFVRLAAALAPPSSGSTTGGAHPCGPSGGPGGGFEKGNWCWTLKESHIAKLLELRQTREKSERAREKKDASARNQQAAKARRKQAAFRRTQRFKDISETLQTKDESVIRDFAGLMGDMHKRLRNTAQQYNDAFDELVDQSIGQDASGRRNRGAFVSQLRRASDPTKVPRFDEVVQFVRDNPATRQIMASNLGESTGKGDIEAMVFQGLRSGKREIPGLNSNEVWNEALDFLGEFGDVKQTRIRMAQVHAPKGGVTVGGSYSSISGL